MRNAMILVILVALGLAGGTALVVRGFLGKAASPEDGPLPTQVLVAAQDLPAGTILNANHWRWQAWPDGSADKGFIVRIRATPDRPAVETLLPGAAVKRAIFAGEPITFGKVIKPGEAGFLAGALGPGQRAIGLKINAVSSASGFVLPGDRVDVILTQQLRAGGDGRPHTVSETILRNIRVLTIDQSADDLDKKAKVGQTATLEVSPKQAEALSTATTIGALSLTLRSFERGAGEDTARGVTSDRDVSKAYGEDEPASAAAPEEREPYTLRLYRGEQLIELPVQPRDMPRGATRSNPRPAPDGATPKPRSASGERQL